MSLAQDRTIEAVPREVLIQGVVLWVAMIYMVVNLVVDLTYDLVDPRIREAR